MLLNDIDMAAVESWTPIGGVDASEYNTTTPYKTVNPFKGTFDGQGFAVKNLNYTADMSHPASGATRSSARSTGLRSAT